jgi:hypothetical protein
MQKERNNVVKKKQLSEHDAIQPRCTVWVKSVDIKKSGPGDDLQLSEHDAIQPRCTVWVKSVDIKKSGPGDDLQTA